MPSTLDLSLLIAQMPHVAQLATVAHTHPEMQQALFSAHARQELLRESKQVQKVEKKSAASRIDKDLPRDESRGQFHAHQHRHAQHALREDDVAKPTKADSLLGNIVDMDV